MNKQKGRRAMCCLILAGLAAVGVAARTTPTDSTQPNKGDRVLIEQLLNEQAKAWNEGNIDEFLRGYLRSEALTFSGSGGISRGWKGVRERYMKTYPDSKAMGKLDFSELEMRALGPDAILVLGQWHLEREPSDIGGVFTLVLQRFPQGWKIVHDHTSAMAKQAKPDAEQHK